MDGLSGVLPHQNVDAELHAQHVVQTDDRPFAVKAGHAVEVIRSHRHLPLGDIKGMGSVPPPLDKALH